MDADFTLSYGVLKEKRLQMTWTDQMELALMQGWLSHKCHVKSRDDDRGLPDTLEGRREVLCEELKTHGAFRQYSTTLNVNALETKIKSFIKNLNRSNAYDREGVNSSANWNPLMSLYI